MEITEQIGGEFDYDKLKRIIGRTQNRIGEGVLIR